MKKSILMLLCTIAFILITCQKETEVPNPVTEKVEISLKLDRFTVEESSFGRTAAVDWTHPIDWDAVAQLVIIEKSGIEPSAHCTIPEEFLDPLLNVLMEDPVILPDSKVTCDRRTIQRHLSISPTDPFSRQELKEEDLIPNIELMARLQRWLKSHMEEGS